MSSDPVELSSDSPPDAEEAAPITPLLEPADGLPDVITTPAQLRRCVDAINGGEGPIAIDAERASGYRYGQRAYLVQLRRRGSGTHIIDPIEFSPEQLEPLADALRQPEWVLHAANQDLPCLGDLGLRPNALFDTELAGRLLGHERVGLAAMTESVLGLGLVKGHSAADWSTRPLPVDWIRYAALDVEVLVELRDALATELLDQGKQDWASQEFAALVDAPAATPRTDPWRRTSGIHRLRSPRQIAIVRQLWESRDSVARKRDVSPGRVLADPAIIEAAINAPTSKQSLTELAAFRGRGARRHLDLWWSAIERANHLAVDDLPPLHLPAEGPPPARSWNDRNPAAANRLAAVKTVVAALADEHGLPTENLLAPDTVRRLAWDPPPGGEAGVRDHLAGHRARPWQIDLTVHPLAKALDRVARELPA